MAAAYHAMDDSIYEAEARGRQRTALRHLGIVHDFAAPGRLLDVGCAGGAFLAAAGRAGWRVLGIEPSESLSARARALLGPGTVVRGTFEDTALEPASFDAVTLWDVLEHAVEPLSFLQKCRACVRPGGHVFANVPDLGSLPARLLGRRWPLLLPEHLQYFTTTSVQLAGEQAGLELAALGRRKATFSAGYVAYRLAQHRVPGSRLASRLLAGGPLARTLVPLPLGELYAVWRRPTAS